MWHVSNGAGGGGGTTTSVPTVGTTLTKSSHGLSVADAVTVAGTKARANSTTTLARGVVTAVPTSGTYTIVTSGYATLTAHGLGTAGQSLYLSQGTAGLLTSTAPVTGIIQEVGEVYDADTIYVGPIVATTV